MNKASLDIVDKEWGKQREGRKHLLDSVGRKGEGKAGAVCRTVQV